MNTLGIKIEINRKSTASRRIRKTNGARWNCESPLIPQSHCKSNAFPGALLSTFHYIRAGLGRVLNIYAGTRPHTGKVLNKEAVFACSSCRHQRQITRGPICQKDVVHVGQVLAESRPGICRLSDRHPLSPNRFIGT